MSQITIRRCQHIKVNGIQCGSPALRDERRCFFHEQCLVRSRRDLLLNEPGISQLASLEDANSIQLALAEVMRLLITQGIDRPTASLLLRVLRTAALNVKFTSFEPKPTQVVVDPDSVENRPLGATAWSTEEGKEYDEGVIEPAATNNNNNKKEPDSIIPELSMPALGDELQKTEAAIAQHLAAAPRDYQFPSHTNPISSPPPAPQEQPN
jgi:hypothetical protein